MRWSDQIFAYCERGSDPAFWAEPLNTISNAAFFVAAAMALVTSNRSLTPRYDPAELFLIATVFVIGVGSFLFHTTAARWAAIADAGPIAVFMLVYLGYALRRFVGLEPIGVVIGIAVFLAALVGARLIPCGGGACLNGSLGYTPALAALVIVGGALTTKRHSAGPVLLLAAGVFAVSLVFRTIDLTVCARTLVRPGWNTGTHALWHLLNAAMIYLLLRAAIRHGGALIKVR
jgi:Ceramidase